MNEVIDEKELKKEKVTNKPHCKYCGHELVYIVKYCPRCGERLY